MHGWRLVVPAGVLAAVTAAVPATGARRAAGLPVTDRAVFDVVVEGGGRATRDVSLDGQLDSCTITSRTQTTQVFRYGRGRGLRAEFLRIGRGRASVVILHRVGRPMFAPVVFNVRGTYTDEASGAASRSGPSAVCQPAQETVGDESSCGTRRGAENFGLAYRGGRLTLEMSGDALPPLPSPALCGANGIETASGPVLHGFGEPADLKPGVLSARRIFGTVRAFRVPLRSPGAHSTENPPNPALDGSVVNDATHGATVRFIRVGSG